MPDLEPGAVAPYLGARWMALRRRVSACLTGPVAPHRSSDRTDASGSSRGPRLGRRSAS